MKDRFVKITGSTPDKRDRRTAANPDQWADSAIAEDINAKLMASNTLRPLDLQHAAPAGFRHLGFEIVNQDSVKYVLRHSSEVG